MNILYLIIFFLIGLCMGSFYTVVGLRLPKHEDFIANRSYCDHCHHELSFFDMIPIFSYIFLRGKCRYCNKKIDNISTFMEVFTGILFALSYYAFGFSYQLYIALGIVSMLVIISVSDISYYIIPDEVLIFFTGYFLIIYTLNIGVINTFVNILSGVIMFAIMYTIMLLGNFIFKKESLGGGDIKLMFVIGLVLTPLLGLFVIFIGSLIALPISLIILCKQKKKIIPFGPFLLIAFAFIYFTKIDSKTILDMMKSLMIMF
ncbi:MAG: prepilin peptidase [Bacilli bacterium]|nr:prepilin peptidase [Bacilli bacterium]